MQIIKKVSVNHFNGSFTLTQGHKKNSSHPGYRGYGWAEERLPSALHIKLSDGKKSSIVDIKKLKIPLGWKKISSQRLRKIQKAAQIFIGHEIKDVVHKLKNGDFSDIIKNIP